MPFAALLSDSWQSLGFKLKLKLTLAIASTSTALPQKNQDRGPWGGMQQRDSFMVIRIPIPNLHEATDLVVYVQTHLDLFTPAMDLEVSEFDAKAQVGSIVILSVTQVDQTVRISYKLTFSADYTCSGIEYAGSHARSILGTVAAADWLFVPPAPMPERSTVEEF